MPHAEPRFPNAGPLARILEWVRAQSGGRGELAEFSHDERRHMAADLSLAGADLRDVAARGRDNTALMEGMMHARGLDPDRLRQAFPMLMRDVERVCTQCRSVRRCRRELDAGTAAVLCYEYCPNTSTFDDLVEEREFSSCRLPPDQRQFESRR